MTWKKYEKSKQATVVPAFTLVSSWRSGQTLRGCHPVQVIMNRPTRIHTAYPGLLEPDHSRFLHFSLHLKNKMVHLSVCGQYLMHSTVDLHRNDEVSVADGL